LGFQIFNICTKLRQHYKIYHSPVIQHPPQFQFNDRLPSKVANPLNAKLRVSLEYQKIILQVKQLSHCRNKNITTVFENPQLNSILNQFSIQLLISSYRSPSNRTQHNQLYMTISLTACIIFPRPTDTPFPLIS
jgi:hypothetical protein